MNPLDQQSRIACARISLDGVALGDAFGEQFFCDPDEARARIESRSLPDGYWRFSDDTVMACGVFETLHRNQGVDQQVLADTFARNHRRDMARGYGAGAHRILQRIHADGDWCRHSTAIFGGAGSFGNGAAMRATPIGAYFFDDLERVVSEANKSAMVTHSHPEGRAGAIAVAVAAATAWACRGDAVKFRESVFRNCMTYTPPGEVRDGIERARNTSPTASIHLAAKRLGNGREISAQDTVPLVLWCAHRHVESIEEVLWTTVSALGDRDTTCAMVGGIVSLFVGPEGLPSSWMARRESLKGWIPD